MRTQMYHTDKRVFYKKKYLARSKHGFNPRGVVQGGRFAHFAHSLVAKVERG